MAATTKDLNPTRSSLLSRLQNWDGQDSWRDFFDTYWRLICAVAHQVISVAKNIAKFKPELIGLLKQWQ